ncbi:hypothetical protein DPMN_146190 [Dreissena polymorpha]|uniref:Uncharacterized protein n=1 Tax=Dreissena polymorpha TaxID=45954 RepID=A0A9D4F7G1_DREPO|nr:hypothetical protein DPMN_146190 [Dreissena polymorpha]
MIKNDEPDIKLQSNREFIHYRADCNDLGKIIKGEPKHDVGPITIISIQDKSEYNVRTTTDKFECSITGICKNSNGDLVIADFDNMCVNLLKQTH